MGAILANQRASWEIGSSSGMRKHAESFQTRLRANVKLQEDLKCAWDDYSQPSKKYVQLWPHNIGTNLYGSLCSLSNTYPTYRFLQATKPLRTNVVHQTNVLILCSPSNEDTCYAILQTHLPTYLFPQLPMPTYKVNLYPAGKLDLVLTSLG